MNNFHEWHYMRGSLLNRLRCAFGRHSFKRLGALTGVVRADYQGNKETWLGRCECCEMLVHVDVEFNCYVPHGQLQEIGEEHGLPPMDYGLVTE